MNIIIMKIRQLMRGQLLRVLLLILFPVSLQAQAPIDTTRLVFDLTLATEPILRMGNSLYEADETSEEYSSALATIVSYELEVDNILQQANSPYNFELFEQYLSLGDTNQSIGRHEEAITHYESALQILKVKNGLDDMNQLPVTEKIVQSLIAMGDLDRSTRWREYEHYVHQNNFEPGSIEMVRATNDLADWYISSFFMENFQREARGLAIMLSTQQQAPRLTSQLVGQELQWNGVENGMRLSNQNPSTYIDPTMEAIFNGNIRHLAPRDVEDVRLLRVSGLYEDSQRDIIASDSPSLDSIAQIARRIAGLSFITKQEIDYENFLNTFIPNYENSRVQEYRLSQNRLDQSYESGRNALQNIVDIMRRVEAPANILSSALIELADWNLAYGRVQAAQGFYTEAYSELVADGFTRQQIDNSLNLAIPRQIPRSATHAYTRRSSGMPLNAELEYRGYVDVSFELDDLGNPQKVEFSENDRPEFPQIEQILRNHLRTAKFRPHFTEGELVNQGRVDLRYYYSY
jgi:tetratricopeptide (TPR) repeat protein